MTVTNTVGDRQPQKICGWKPQEEAVCLWAQILLLEPETNPWEFACKAVKMGWVPEDRVWDAAEWADGVRENVRRLAFQREARGFRRATGSA
jgi:hypothetical protein